MEYTTPTEQQSREAIYALGEAERILSNPSPSYQELFLHHTVLTADTNGLQLLRMQPRYRARLEAVLEGIGRIAPEQNYSVTDAELIPGNWAQCIAGCEAKSLEVATLRQIAELRVKHGKDSEYCTNGRWAGEGQIYTPYGRLIITPREFNPLIANAEEATKAHGGKEFKEYYIDESILTRQLLSASLVLERDKIPSEILTKDFGNDTLTSFIGWGREYAELLEAKGITSIQFRACPKNYVKTQKKAFSRCLWVFDLGGDSAIDGSLLSYDGGCVFGVRRSGIQVGSSVHDSKDQQSTTGFSLTMAVLGFLIGHE